MSDSIRDELTTVRCAHCKRILKYPHTVDCLDPRTGLMIYRTRVLLA